MDFKTFVFSLWSALVLSACTNINGQNTGKLMVCYFTQGGMSASDIPADLCTHVIYAFGVMSSQGISPQRSGDIQAYRDLVNLKHRNPNLKVLISIQQGFDTVVPKGAMAVVKFCHQATSFLTKYGFDGLDLDWEYPHQGMRNAYALFIHTLGPILHSKGFLLSAALPNNRNIFDSRYDVTSLKLQMDFMTVMTYDFHVYLPGIDNRTGYNSPLFTPPHEYKYFSTKALLNYLVSAGLPADKLLMGLPMYGRSWKLQDPMSHALHAPAIGKGDPGPYSHITGLYLHGDVCAAVRGGASTFQDGVNGAEYLYKGSTWVSYDGFFSLKLKLSWLKTTSFSFKGVGIWALQLDDRRGVCQQGKFPLLNYIKSNLF